MVDAAENVVRFVSGRSRSDLDTDRMLLFAVVRAVEILGEAASQLSDETRSRAADIPWRAIVGMRNRVVHAYFDIDADIYGKRPSKRCRTCCPVCVSSSNKRGKGEPRDRA